MLYPTSFMHISCRKPKKPKYHPGITYRSSQVLCSTSSITASDHSPSVHGKRYAAVLKQTSFYPQQNNDMVILRMKMGADYILTLLQCTFHVSAARLCRLIKIYHYPIPTPRIAFISSCSPNLCGRHSEEY